MEYKNAYLQIVEEEYLSRYAQHVKDTKGRLKPIEPCPLRTEYQRDRDRIIHCKAFRRLKHKTQVFLSPEGDHYRTRLTHTLEVAQIARTMARALRLNEDLTEAISLVLYIYRKTRFFYCFSINIFCFSLSYQKKVFYLHIEKR